ncbi:M56 family metallopeptidase [Cloacibacterium sp.]|uniref:M56 family metallopeptidase n=1 Tax=Cloacibacterium sp. TaxID=1913682 RepID=UPI0035AD7A4C
METIFLYFGKMILVSAVMSAYYLLFLRDKTFHHYNRFYLLGTMVLSLLLPLLKVEYFTIETDSRILLLLNQFNQNSAQEVENSFNFWDFGALILGIVSFFLLAKLTLGLVKIHQLKKEFPKESIKGITFYNTNLHDAPFSFFRNLFWKKSILINSDLGKQILKHEMVHIEQKHSFDKLFVQIIQSLFWFNPIFYFIKKEITLIHEYLADKKAVKNADTRAFAQMLLASNFSGNVLPATSPFLSSNLKKRLKMLTQKNTKYSYARRILALPILFGVSFALLVNAKNIEIKKQNKAIEIAVQELKKDTVKEKDVQKLLEAQQAKINKASEKIKKENEKIATLSEQTRKKSEELQKIAKEKGADSYDYELKAKELENLGNEIDRIANSEAYQNNWKEFEFNFNEMEKFFNVEDFKNKFKLNEEKMKELEKKFNSKEFKDKIIRIQKVRTPQMMDVEVPAPITPPISIEKLKNSPNSNLTKEEIKKLDKLSKERAELSKKQAELARKQAEIAKQQAEISRKYAQNNPWIITVDANVPKHGVVSVSADKIKYNLATKNSEVEGLKSMKVISDKSIKYYINGKLSTKEEMDKLNPNDIATVNVNKNVNNGKEEGEIRIQTK